MKLIRCPFGIALHCGPLRTFVVLLCLAVAGETAAKRTTPARFQLVAIQVSGNSHYSSDQIILLSGLHLGQDLSDDGKTVNEDIFREAAKQIGDTGAFKDVRYRFEYSALGTKLNLQVSENEKFVTAVFCLVHG